MPWCGDIELDRKVLHKGRLLHIYFLKSRVQKPEQLLYISTMTCNYCGTICFIIWMSFFRKYFVKPRQLHSFSLHLHFFFFWQPKLFFVTFYKVNSAYNHAFHFIGKFQFSHLVENTNLFVVFMELYILFEIPYSKGKESADIGLISILEMFYR